VSHTLKKCTKLGKPSKHDTLAHLFQFVDYVEDFINTPKHLRKNLDMSVLRNKCTQCKEVLEEAQGN
jgi:hypothetical protein